MFSVSEIAIAKNVAENKNDISGNKKSEVFLSGKKKLGRLASGWVGCPWQFIEGQRQL